MKFQFPHFSHRIPSRVLSSLEITLLWISLISLFVVNLIATQALVPLHWKPLMELFMNPFSVSRHTDLAKTLWEYGQREPARKLMASAEVLSSPLALNGNGGGTVNVLGVTTRPKDTLFQWEHQDEALKNEYTRWQVIAAAKPDYRDAYLRLATLAYQLGNLDASKQWIHRALELDPNYSEAIKISVLLQ